MTNDLTPERPLRVALVNDYEIVVKGIAAALAPFSDRLVQKFELPVEGWRGPVGSARDGA